MEYFRDMQNSSLLVAVVVGGLFYIGGQYVAAGPERASEQLKSDRELTVQGQGRASGVSDTALISLGARTEPMTTAEAATAAMAENINKVIEAVKALGIAEEDLKTTDLSVQPEYNFNRGERELAGYAAQQTLEVKAREPERIGEIVAAATREGANQTGGVRYETADEEALQLEAQQQAIADAKQKAEALAEALGVRLGGVKKFESSGGEGPVPLYLEADTRASETAPQTPTGTQEVSAVVTITYTFE